MRKAFRRCVDVASPSGAACRSALRQDVAIVATLLATIACTREAQSHAAEMETAPPAFEVTTFGGSASTPPPGHYDWEIVVRRGGGEMTYWPDYDRVNNPVWRYKFDVSDALIDSLWTTAKREKLWTSRESSDHRVGGRYSRLKLSDGRRSVELNESESGGGAASSALAGRVSGLIPGKVWKEFSDSLDAWSARWYERKAREAR